MNWNDLKVFLAIAEAGTLAGAARSLQQNHSTVFRRLNALETDMDVRLFERLPGHYSLTPAGERMLELARGADAAVQSIERELAGRDLEPRGTVRVTTAPNIARAILPGALQRLRKSYPGVLVEVSVGDSDYNLARREADIALRATSSPPETLVGRKVADLQWWVCAAATQRSRLPKSVSGLREQPLIGADTAFLRVQAYQWLEQQCGATIVARANDISTMAALAKAGVGLALLPSDQDMAGLRRVFRVKELRGELWLLTHPDLRKVRKIRVVWDALAEATASFTAA